MIWILSLTLIIQSAIVVMQIISLLQMKDLELRISIINAHIEGARQTKEWMDKKRAETVSAPVTSNENIQA